MNETISQYKRRRILNNNLTKETISSYEWQSLPKRSNLSLHNIQRMRTYWYPHERDNLAVHAIVMVLQSQTVECIASVVYGASQKWIDPRNEDLYIFNDARWSLATLLAQYRIYKMSCKWIHGAGNSSLIDSYWIHIHLFAIIRYKVTILDTTHPS